MTTVTDPLSDFFFSTEERNVEIGEALRPALVTSDREELLAFVMGKEEYALAIIDVLEIIKVPEITEVPRTASFLLGIISLRGTIVPVIDLAVTLGFARKAPSAAARVVVLRGEGEPMGLLVDQVSSVVRIEREAIEAVPKALQHKGADLLKGVGRIEERMVVILDAAALLQLPETA